MKGTLLGKNEVSYRCHGDSRDMQGLVWEGVVGVYLIEKAKERG